MKSVSLMMWIVMDTCVSVQKAMKPVLSAKRWHLIQSTVKR